MDTLIALTYLLAYLLTYYLLTGLPYGEETITIYYAVFIEYRNVTDGRTDRQTDGRTDLLYQYRASVC